MRIHILLLTLISSCVSLVGERIEYYSHDKSTVMIFRDGKGYIGPNPAAPNFVGQELSEYELLEDLQRLPLNNGRCLSYMHFTFATVNQQSVGDIYECNGVIFRTEECAQNGLSCSTAHISARCYGFREGRCNPRGMIVEGPASYTFVYDRTRGLLSVDFAPEAAGRPAVMTLIGQRGLIL